MFKKLLLVSIILSNLVGCSNEIDYNQFDIPQQDNYENYKKDHHIDQKTTTNSIKSYKEIEEKRQEESHCAVNNFKVVKTLVPTFKHK